MYMYIRMLPYSGIGLGTRLAPVLREHLFTVMRKFTTVKNTQYAITAYLHHVMLRVHLHTDGIHLCTYERTKVQNPRRV